LFNESNKAIPVELAKGFKIKLASEFTAKERARVHGRAFNNELSKEPDLMNERTKGCEGLINAPDYNESIDLCVVDEEGEIASFATLWFDAINKIGILEPVGTILKYRRKV